MTFTFRAQPLVTLYKLYTLLNKKAKAKCPGLKSESPVKVKEVPSPGLPLQNPS
jgi:hypothetical protein